MYIYFFFMNSSLTLYFGNLTCFIQIWSIGSSAPSFTLDGHSKGVNCVDYFEAENKTYIYSGSDDFTAKVSQPYQSFFYIHIKTLCLKFLLLQ